MIIHVQELLLNGVWLGLDVRTHTQKMCFQEIGLCAQNVLAILHSIVRHYCWGDLYDQLMSTRIATLMMNKIFMSPKNYWGNASETT